MSEAMRTVVIQLLSAFMGAGSFAILFQLKRKYLFIAALGAKSNSKSAVPIITATGASRKPNL